MMLKSMEHVYAAGLQRIKNFGAVRVRSLVEFFGSFEGVWKASEMDLKAASLLGPKQIHSFLEERRNYCPEKEFEMLEKMGGYLITFKDTEYPLSLATCCNAPAILACKGKGKFKEKSIAIVGTRKPTPYGINACKLFSDEIAKQGVTLVSGGARGIDSIVHQSGIEFSDTIAVLACGLDITYPPENKKMFNKIEENGLLVTEYPLGTKPLGRQFPARNRIISGLSKAVVVIEAAKRSGTLITADFALEEGRDVFAVPGSIFSEMSEGTHHLIRQGALFAATPQDVLVEYDWLDEYASSTKSNLELTSEEMLVLKYCKLDSATDVDSIIEKSMLHPTRVNYTLLQLEFKGIIRNVGNQRYIAIAKE